MPRTKHHLYCTRKCFKKDYRKKQKEETLPLFVCPNCGNVVRLKFQPRENYQLWRNFHCPNCGYSNTDNAEND